MTGIDRKMKVISSCLGFHHRGRGGHRGEFGLYKSGKTRRAA